MSTCDLDLLTLTAEESSTRYRCFTDAAYQMKVCIAPEVTAVISRAALIASDWLTCSGARPDPQQVQRLRGSRHWTTLGSAPPIPHPHQRRRTRLLSPFIIRILISIDAINTARWQSVDWIQGSYTPWPTCRRLLLVCSSLKPQRSSRPRRLDPMLATSIF